MLKAIRSAAEDAAHEFDINWEMMDDPDRQHELLETLEYGRQMIPTLESLYEKLQNGESTLFKGQPTALPYKYVEKYREVVENELFGCYQMASLLERIELIQRITNSGGLDKRH